MICPYHPKKLKKLRFAAATGRMALDEEQSSAAHEMRRAIDCLRDCADLAEVDPATLKALAAGAVHFSLAAGNLLFESGTTPDGVYLLAGGRLGVKTLANAGLTAVGRLALSLPGPAVPAVPV